MVEIRPPEVREGLEVLPCEDCDVGVLGLCQISVTRIIEHELFEVSTI